MQCSLLLMAHVLDGGVAYIFAGVHHSLLSTCPSRVLLETLKAMLTGSLCGRGLIIVQYVPAALKIRPGMLTSLRQNREREMSLRTQSRHGNGFAPLHLRAVNTQTQSRQLNQTPSHGSDQVKQAILLNQGQSKLLGLIKSNQANQLNHSLYAILIPSCKMRRGGASCPQKLGDTAA